MNLTVRTALEMLQGVQALDSYANGDKTTFYKYDPATRLALAGIRRNLRAVQEQFVETRNAMLLEMTEGTGELPAINGQYRDPEERKTALRQHILFNARERELLAAAVELELPRLTAAQLNLEENPIPAGVIDMLGELIR